MVRPNHWISIIPKGSERVCLRVCIIRSPDSNTTDYSKRTAEVNLGLYLFLNRTLWIPLYIDKLH